MSMGICGNNQKKAERVRTDRLTVHPHPLRWGDSEMLAEILLATAHIVLICLVKFLLDSQVNL